MQTTIHRKAAFVPLLIASLNLMALFLLFSHVHKFKDRNSTALVQYLPREEASHPFNPDRVSAANSDRTPVIMNMEDLQSRPALMVSLRDRALAINEDENAGNCIKIPLSSEVRYDQLVSIINLMVKNHIHRYGIMRDTFCIFPPYENRLARLH